jgi:hypothetical protein
MRVFTVFPQIVIAKTFQEIGEDARAIEILTNISKNLLSDVEIQKEQMPEMIFFAKVAAGQIVEAFISLNQIEMAKQLIPILKTEDTDSRQLPAHLFDQRTLLAKLGEYDKEDLLTELEEIKTKLGTTERKLPLQELGPEDFLPEGPVTTKPLFSVPPEYQQIAKLSQLAQIAENLGASEVVEEITELLKKIGGSDRAPKLKEEQMKQLERERKSILLPNQIIEAFNEKDEDKTEELLKELENQIKENIKQLEKRPIPSSSPWGLPRIGDMNVRRLLFQAGLAEVLMQIDRQERVNEILEEIKTYYMQNNPLEGMGRGAQPGYPPLGLYRRYLVLKLKMGYKEEELTEIVEYTQQNDPTGLPFLGILLLKAGNMTKAQEISDLILKPQMDPSKKVTTWESYYKRKSQILEQLGEKKESMETLKQIGKDPKDLGKFWEIGREAHLAKLLLGGDLKKIEREIETAVENLGTYYVWTALKPLFQSRPPKGVTQEVWVEARKILGDQLTEILGSFDSPIKGPISFQTIDTIIYLLRELERKEEAHRFSLQILATLQKAVEQIAPTHIIKQLEFLPVTPSTWKYEKLLERVGKEPHLKSSMARGDYWRYYKTTTDEPPLRYEKFDTTLKNWIKESRTGKNDNFFLYISIPYIYSVMVRIFSRLEDKNNISLCYRNSEVLRKERLKKVQKTPETGRIDSDWYLNLFDQIKKELKGRFENYDYETAKEQFNLALILLDDDGVKQEDQMRHLNEMMGYLADY